MSFCTAMTQTARTSSPLTWWLATWSSGLTAAQEQLLSGKWCCLCFLLNSATVLMQERSGLERVTAYDEVCEPLGLLCLVLGKHRSTKILVKGTGFSSYISMFQSFVLCLTADVTFVSVWYCSNSLLGPMTLHHSWLGDL